MPAVARMNGNALGARPRRPRWPRSVRRRRPRRCGSRRRRRARAMTVFEIVGEARSVRWQWVSTRPTRSFTASGTSASGVIVAASGLLDLDAREQRLGLRRPRGRRRTSCTTAAPGRLAGPARSAASSRCAPRSPAWNGAISRAAWRSASQSDVQNRADARPRALRPSTA